MNGVQKTALNGTLAGAAGTAAMTLMMRRVAPKVIPEEMRPDEFVPKKAVEWAEEQAGVPEALTKEEEMKAAMGAHFTYGSSMGALYGLARSTLLREAALPLAGALFGLGVWAASFEGWMPKLGIMEATTEKPPKKWPMPIMAHLVYGATTALAYEVLDRGGARQNARA
jgi:hypothetical protein